MVGEGMKCPKFLTVAGFLRHNMFPAVNLLAEFQISVEFIILV